MKTVLSRTAVLWWLFLGSIGLTFSFVLLAGSYGLTFIDGLVDPVLVRSTIDALSAEQRATHAWITATVDVAYPLVYGSFFAGMAWRCFPRTGTWLALPGLVAIPVDLLEGIVQVLALTGTRDWLEAKLILTPLKFALFYAGLAIVVVALFRRLYEKRRIGA